jgi:hypothetical protein
MAKISGADLYEPNGVFAAFMFPRMGKNVILAKLDGYVTAAYRDARITAQASDTALQNDMARHYASYLGLRSVLLRMATKPGSVTITEKGGHAYSADQRAIVERLANEQLAAFLELVPTSTVGPATPGATSIPVRLNF